jgi:hypothetical protein
MRKIVAFFAFLAICSVFMIILISVTIAPTMQGTVIIMVSISFFLLIFALLFSLYVLLLSASYSYLFIQGESHFFIKFITDRKYIYDDGKIAICYRINKAQKSYKVANNLSEFSTSAETFNNVFRLEKYKTISGYQERFVISNRVAVSKWCKKVNLDFNDKVIKNLTISLLSSSFETKFEYQKSGIYKVEPQIEKYIIEQDLGDFEIKYRQQFNVGILKIVSAHHVSANSDTGYGGKSITKYTIKQFHNIKNLNDIKHKEKSVYSIIQTICKDTGMQIPKQ